MELTAEEMRTAVLELIRVWLTHSNANNKPDAVFVLNAIAGDIQMIQVKK